MQRDRNTIGHMSTMRNIASTSPRWHLLLLKNLNNRENHMIEGNKKMIIEVSNMIFIRKKILQYNGEAFAKKFFRKLDLECAMVLQ